MKPLTAYQFHVRVGEKEFGLFPGYLVFSGSLNTRKEVSMTGCAYCPALCGTVEYCG